MPEPVTILSALGGALGATSRAVLHVADLVQTPEEVDAAAAEITKCQQKLDELMDLRRRHAALLAARPDDERSIEVTIKETWEALGRAMPILERNRISYHFGGGGYGNFGKGGRGYVASTKNPAARLGRRLRWKICDRNMWSIHEKAILRNQIEVRDQIVRLEQIVRFGPLEAVAEKVRGEERRKREDMERARADRDVQGLEEVEVLDLGLVGNGGGHGGYGVDEKRFACAELPAEVAWRAKTVTMEAVRKTEVRTVEVKKEEGQGGAGIPPIVSPPVFAPGRPGMSGMQKRPRMSLISGVAADLMALGVDEEQEVHHAK